MSVLLKTIDCLNCQKSFHILRINSSTFGVGLTGGEYLVTSPVEIFMDTTRIPRRSQGLCLVSWGNDLGYLGVRLEFGIRLTMTSDVCG